MYEYCVQILMETIPWKTCKRVKKIRKEKKRFNKQRKRCVKCKCPLISILDFGRKQNIIK